MASSGEITDPCPPVTDPYDLVFEHPRLEPFPDQADDARIADPMFQEGDQPFLVDLVNERSDVGIYNPVHLGAVHPDYQSIQRIMLAAPRPKPLRKPEEVLLVDRVQHRRDRALDELVSPPRFPPKPPDPWSLQLHHNFHHVDGRDPGGFQRDFPALMKAALLEGVADKPLELWFTDEARVGQQGSITRIWAKRGSRHGRLATGVTMGVPVRRGSARNAASARRRSCRR